MSSDVVHGLCWVPCPHHRASSWPGGRRPVSIFVFLRSRLSGRGQSTEAVWSLPKGGLNQAFTKEANQALEALTKP